MTTSNGCSPETVAGEAESRLPLQYEDGPDYCTVTDNQDRPFAMTVQPDLLKAMERALYEEMRVLSRKPEDMVELLRKMPSSLNDACRTMDEAANLIERLSSGIAQQPVSAADAWQELINKDDRTSPEEYPEMALITSEELADFMSRNSAPQETRGDEPVAWQYRVQYDDGSWSDWMACKKTMHDTYRAMGRIGQCPAETRELAVVPSTDRAPIAGASDRVDEAACLIWSELCPSLIMGDNDRPHYENAARAVLALRGVCK